jgi:hypothetical protein
MQLDFTQSDPIDKIAELTRSLTYGDMIDFAAELWKAAGDADISAETLPAILHRWASNTRHQLTAREDANKVVDHRTLPPFAPLGR